MPCSSRKKTRAIYFQRRNHRQKGVERRWRDKYLDLERKYESVLETYESVVIWVLFIIIIIIIIIIYTLINKFKKNAFFRYFF
jgi:hypothetical protein